MAENAINNKNLIVMRKIILTIVALCLMATSVFAAVGDKVYFVNNADFENLYVEEYSSDWDASKKAYGTAVSEGWQYDGKDVYSYTITSADCYYFGVNDGTHWTSGSIRPVAGHYYLIETDNTSYWLTEKYYNEYYFMDNNSESVLGVTPNIALAKSDWTYLNGTWEGQAMTSIGTFKMGESTYPAWKYVYLTSEPVGHVQFLKSTDTSVKVGQDQALVAGKNYYSWWGWHTLDEVADRVQLVGDAAICGTNWGDDENNVMWLYEGVYSVTLKDVLITIDGDYKFRVYPGFGTNNWNARFPHANVADWHETVHLAPGLYTLYFVYDPATDALTCTPTACYSRNVGAADKWGTICLPNPSTAVSGATFYTVAGKEGSSILLEEITGNLEAGHPYIFQSTAEWVNVTLNASSYENAWSNYNGLCGSYVEYALTPDDGNYLLYDGQFYEATGANARVGQYRAFLNLSNVPSVSPAPGRRYVRMTVNGENTATGIEESGSETANAVRSEKCIVNGQLLIIRNGEKYNAQGVTVK